MKNTLEAARLFQLWAPPEVVWSRWVKPVIFAQEVIPTMGGASLTTPSPKRIGIAGRWPEEDAPAYRGAAFWANYVDNLPLDQSTALVVDVPGADAVTIGLRLATRGMRPAPIFNTCNGPAAVVKIDAIIERLAQGATMLPQMPLPVNAPPAFLIDSKRNHTSIPPEPGDFDNRWMVFPYDFPSATFLAAQGIKTVILLYDTQAEDLSHVLKRWHDAGLTVVTQRWTTPGPLQPYHAFRPPYFRQLWYAFLITLAHNLRYSNVGGFGAMWPHPTQGRTG